MKNIIKYFGKIFIITILFLQIISCNNDTTTADEKNNNDNEDVSSLVGVWRGNNISIVFSKDNTIINGVGQVHGGWGISNGSGFYKKNGNNVTLYYLTTSNIFGYVEIISDNIIHLNVIYVTHTYLHGTTYILTKIK